MYTHSRTVRLCPRRPSGTPELKRVVQREREDGGQQERPGLATLGCACWPLLVVLALCLLVRGAIAALAVRGDGSMVFVHFYRVLSLLSCHCFLLQDFLAILLVLIVICFLPSLL